MAAHAILKACCAYEPARIRTMAVRFTSPVYPGETVRFQFWRRAGKLHLRARIDARDVVVLNNGIVDLI
jgi:acyl dehydratase